MKKIFLLLLVILSLFSLSSCDSKSDKLVVYTEAGFKPFEYESSDGISGVDVDIMMMVGEKLNKEVVFENVSFDIIVDEVSKGTLANVGAAGLSITDERKEKVDFSQVYYQANLFVIYNKASGINSKVMTTNEEGVYWSSLVSSKGVGVQSGTTADFFLTDEIELEGGSLYNTNTKKHDFDSLDAAIMDIGLNIDYVIIDELPAKKLVESNSKLACFPLYFEGDGIDIKSYDEYAIAVTKGESELLEAINSVLDELLVKDSEGNTEIDKLVAKHLGVKTDEVYEYNLFEALWKVITTPKYLSYLFTGFTNTLLLTILAAIIGLVIGFVVAIIKIFSIDNKYLKVPAVICDIYTTVVRGTPVALQLFIMVFALLAIPGFKVAAVILTFGINSGAYVSESIRAGILSIDKGQMEAGRALGLSKLTTMVKIILPQAIKNVIPAIGNELIALVKETAIVSMVGSTIGTMTFDLNQATNAINKDIANYLAPALLAALLYLAIVYLLTFAIKRLERRFARSDKY